MVKNCSILTEQIASISTHGNDMERQGSWSNLFYFDEALFSIYINKDKKKPKSGMRKIQHLRDYVAAEL